MVWEGVAGTDTATISLSLPQLSFSVLTCFLEARRSNYEAVQLCTGPGSLSPLPLMASSQIW